MKLNLISKKRISLPLFFAMVLGILFFLPAQVTVARLDPPSPPPPSPDWTYTWDTTLYWYPAGIPAVDFYEKIRFFDRSGSGEPDYIDVYGYLTVKASYSIVHRLKINFVLVEDNFAISTDWKLYSSYCDIIIFSDNNDMSTEYYYSGSLRYGVVFTYYSHGEQVAGEAFKVYFHVIFRPANGNDITNDYYALRNWINIRGWPNGVSDYDSFHAYSSFFYGT